MHILEIPSFLPPYGGYFCIEQAKALLSRGHQVGVLHCQQLGVTVYPWHYLTARTDRWHEEIKPFGDSRKLNIYRTNMRGVPRNVRINQQRYCRIVSEMYAEYCARYGTPDILHAHCTQWAGTAAAMISQQTGIPYYITEHLSSGIFRSAYGEHWEKEAWARTLLRETMEHARCVMPVADELVADLAPLFGRDYRWQTVSNVIDTAFYAYRDREPREGRAFRFCCLANANGAFLRMKGYDTLLAAFSQMKNCELHIAGRETDGKALSSIIAGMPNKADIHVHGELSRDEVRQLLYSSDALVLASRSEVQPLVLMEAMSTGMPVVATTAAPMSLRIPGACFTAAADSALSLMEAMTAVQVVTPSPVISHAIERMASPEVVAQKLETLFTETLETL